MKRGNYKIAALLPTGCFHSQRACHSGCFYSFCVIPADCHQAQLTEQDEDHLHTGDLHWTGVYVYMYITSPSLCIVTGQPPFLSVVWFRSLTPHLHPFRVFSLFTIRPMGGEEGGGHWWWLWWFDAETVFIGSTESLWLWFDIFRLLLLDTGKLSQCTRVFTPVQTVSVTHVCLFHGVSFLNSVIREIRHLMSLGPVNPIMATMVGVLTLFCSKLFKLFFQIHFDIKVRSYFWPLPYFPRICIFDLAHIWCPLPFLKLPSHLSGIGTRSALGGGLSPNRMKLTIIHIYGECVNHGTTEQLYYYDDSKPRNLAKDDGWAHAAVIKVNFPVKERYKRNVAQMFIVFTFLNC